MNYQIKNFLRIIKYAIFEDGSQELPLLVKPVDWETMTKIAISHNLMALFHEVAYKYPEYRESPDYEKNTQIAMTIVLRQTQKTEMFLQLYREFLKEDLHPIVMKGIICRQLYGNYGEHRPSGDEDILVKREEFYKVKAVMEAQGYICQQPDVTETQLESLQEITFCESSSRFLIEVHTNVMGHDNKMRTQMGESFYDVFANPRTVMINELPIMTMNHTEHYLFLVLHAFKHFSLSGVGMRQMMDALLYQKTFEQEIDWTIVERELVKNHAATYLGDLQAIGTNFMGIELENCFETCEPEKLLEDMLEVGAFGKREEADILAARINLSTMDCKKMGILAMLRAGFPSKKYMLNVAPYLKENPWMLPIEWIKRWIKFLKQTKKYQGNLMLDSVKRSKQRKELLKKYGL